MERECVGDGVGDRWLGVIRSRWQVYIPLRRVFLAEYLAECIHANSPRLFGDDQGMPPIH